MDDTFEHHVYFESHCLRDVEKKKIRNYFRVHRKSGGGECGDLQTVKENVYRLSFKHRPDQEAVLQKSQHVVKCGEKTLMLTVQGHYQEQTVPLAEDYASPMNVLSPSSSSTPAEGAKQPPEHVWPAFETQSCSTYLLAEAKLRLLWLHIEEDMLQKLPEVKFSRQDVGEIVLEGCERGIEKAFNLIEAKEKMVLVRSLSEISPHLMAFLQTVKPAVLEDILRFDGEVEVDLKGTELKLYSLSSEKLTQTEMLLLGEFKEVNVDVSDNRKSPRLKLKRRVKVMNRLDARVQIRFSDGKACLCGYAREVDKLTENVKRLNLVKCTEEDEGHQQWDELQENEGDSLVILSSEGPSFSYNSASDKVRINLSPKPGSSDNPSSNPEIEGTVFANYQLQEELMVQLCHGDLTKQCVDALVNAANESLDLQGGGISAALSDAAGPQVQAESSALVEKLGKIPVGEVVVTNAGNLRCKKLLHAVGPVAGMAGGNEKILLQETVHSVLSRSEEMGFQSVALPCLSSGSAGVPISVSAEAIITAIKEFGSQGGSNLKRIVLVDNRAEVVRAMQRTCDEILHASGPMSTGTYHDWKDFQKEGTARDGVTPLHVEIVYENIEDQQSDAVVCPMAGHDPHSTRIGNALSNLEGPELATQFYTEEQTFPGDTVLVEGFSTLRYKAVVYVHLVPWDDDPCGTAVEVLKLGINNILNVCESRGFKSVALPPLGVGAALQFPEEVVSEVLHEKLYGLHWHNTQDFQQAESLLPKLQPSHDPPLRIALLGKTGAGKSSLANTIFGEELFNTDHTPLSQTKNCQAETRFVQEMSITLVDTPGFFDTDMSEEELKPEILKLITVCSPGPHALFIVLKVEKFTEQEQDVINKILQHFTEDVLKYTVIIFTHGDQLPDDTNIEQFVGQSKPLSELLSKCNNRCHVVDNRYWTIKEKQEYKSNYYQVGEILNSVVKMVEDNDGAHHSNAMFEKVETEIESEVRLLRQSAKNMSEVEIREKARTTVSKKFLTQLAGIGTGILLGLFFGGGSLTSGPIMGLIRCFGKGPAGVVGAVSMAVDGAVRGACVGYNACKDADSATEAAKQTASAFMKKQGFLKGP